MSTFYNIFKGMFGSTWWGFTTFKKVFSDANFWSAIKNTLVLNLMTLAINFPLTIIVSLMLNMVRLTCWWWGNSGPAPMFLPLLPVP